ncbi:MULTISPECIES: phage terminase small subunit [unclassified Paenibacillus]|uniref:phage terminase small subunit n=1 Tax=unclassified Paenibacillus TaxID=185978 RepID=UPI00247652C0|nr:MULTISPECIES: phage terminase small subunit [unclassified Paenibacillus]
MARARDPNRDQAYQIWLNHGGNITNRQIAEQLGIDEKKVAVWKQRYKWNVVQQTSDSVVQQKRGAPKGNKNAVGNRGGAPPGSKNALGNKGGHGGPYRNDKAVTHGFFRKFLPDDTAEIIEQLETRSPIDMMWDNITIQYAAILRAQQIMLVKGKDDLTKELKKSKLVTTEKTDNEETEWEIQFAWDKQASFLTAQSRAMTTLQNLIRQYDEMCRQGKVDTEQQLRVEKLKKEISLLDQKGASDGSKPPLHIIVDYGDDDS